MEMLNVTSPIPGRTIKYLREASRAIIVRGDEILISHEELSGVWGIPGGGLEDDEGSVACCAREALEETGKIVSVGDWFATTVEFYDEAVMLNKYYVCEIIGEGEMRPTDYEMRVEAHPEWIKIADLLAILEEHLDTDEKVDGSHRVHLRDYTALKAYLKKYGKSEE